MKKYVLYGAGNYGLMILNWLSVENVAFFLDNSPQKQGQSKDGVKIYSIEEKQNELSDYTVVLSANVDRDSDMAKKLVDCGINSFLTYKDLEKEMIKKRLGEAADNISTYDKAIDWIKKNTVSGQGIINNTGQPSPYPEVTGYYIPTLIRWGYRDLAEQYARWLCSIQKDDGSWYGTDDDAPYVFDTAQILKGLLAIRGVLPEADTNIVKACDWLVSHIDEDGRFRAEDEDVWGDGRTLSELIHVYCLSPLKEAGIELGKDEYTRIAERSLEYYVKNHLDKILDFGLLSHFYAYVIEGLIDMGREDIACQAMEKVARLQKDTGAVPAYKNVDWVCSTGLFQFALIWFRLGNIELGERAFSYACKLQNPSGGWFGSYISEENPNEENDYLPVNEISWAVKYFLDALYFRNKAVFNHRKDLYIDTVDKDSSVYKTVATAISDLISDGRNSFKLADVGCGRGSYLKNIVSDFPQAECYGIDISKDVLETINLDRVQTMEGSLTDIPFEDNYFDVVLACESLEHAIDERSAIKELARVTKNNGLIIIIDKHIEALGVYVIERWEKFFDTRSLKNVISEFCSSVEVINNIGHKNDPQIMAAWIGKVKK